MGGFDEHAGIIGDWKPPSPRCRSVSEPFKDDINASGFSFPEPKNSDGSGSERKAGLVERMAARAGYNAPTLNTNMVRETCPPPYLAISPTSFLDSPVFLSNSLVQPSPTTGKFPFAPNDNGGSSMFSDTSDKNKDKLFEGASFAFKPVPESTSGHVSKVDMSWQAFPSRGGQSENRPLPFGSGNGSVEQSRPQDEDAGDNGNNVNSNNGGASEDGYNWRKYGQKQVKGSEYPRSYYKCTHPNCPVKKKVERSHEGHITEIIYKGAHSHPKPPPPSRRAGDNVWTTTNDGNPPSTQFESSDVVDGSSTFSNEEEEEEEEDLATHGSVSLGYDIDGGEGDESESKRRKVEAYATAAAADVSGGSRGLREPRVVVQTTSEVDILDDGYRWRKYGQKVVKGNPNPRSYYKCTSTGCTVRKHVERASHDLKSVITTYEGKHNHDVPAARNSSHVNSQPQIHRPELPSQMGRFDYGLQQAGPPSHGYGYGTGVGQMGMPGFGGHHHNQFIGQMNGMGLMLPKGEPKVEPVSEPGLNLANANASSLYHNQMMNRLPLGPHM